MSYVGALPDPNVFESTYPVKFANLVWLPKPEGEPWSTSGFEGADPARCTVSSIGIAAQRCQGSCCPVWPQEGEGLFKNATKWPNHYSSTHWSIQIWTRGSTRFVIQKKKVKPTKFWFFAIHLPKDVWCRCRPLCLDQPTVNFFVSVSTYILTLLCCHLFSPLYIYISIILLFICTWYRSINRPISAIYLLI